MNWGERLKNLFFWVHPMKTFVVLCGLIAGCVVCLFVPYRYLMMMKILNDFKSGYKRKRSRREWNNMMNNLLLTIPTDKDMEDIFEMERKVIKDIKTSVGNEVALQSLWRGMIWKKGQFNTSYKSRFVVVRNGMIAWWTSEKNAERGMTPRGQLYIGE